MGLLRGFGCDQVQGFLISKPLPLMELVEYLTFEGGQATQEVVS
jgi:EAL domain-containing protein (putative c-di-GMP-specific phosphodiesterase class I)